MPSMPVRLASARAGWHWLRRGLVLLALLLPLLAPRQAAAADLEPQSYRCQGDPLTAQLLRGPLDEPSIPDPSMAAVPVGGFVVLHWRQQSLQLPRTNNAGPASFTDGRWWWSLEDPAHPRFRQRLGFGQVVEIACEQVPP